MLIFLDNFAYAKNVFSEERRTSREIEIPLLCALHSSIMESTNFFESDLHPAVGRSQMSHSAVHDVNKNLLAQVEDQLFRLAQNTIAATTVHSSTPYSRYQYNTMVLATSSTKMADASAKGKLDYRYLENVVLLNEVFWVKWK
jgi:hypothetical protein